MHAYNFFVSGPKFSDFLSNVGRVVGGYVLFRFSFCWSVPKIFAIKVESCQKSRRIYCPPKLLGSPSKICTHVITPASRYVAW